MAVLSFENMYNAVSRFLGTGSTPSGDDLSTAKDIVNAGYRRCLGEYDWSFLRTSGSLTTVANNYTAWMPDDFDRMLTGRLSFDVDQNYSDVLERSYQQIREMRSHLSLTTEPQFFCVVADQYSKTAGTRYRLLLYPTPETAYLLHYSYKFDPVELSDAADRVVGSGDFSHAVLQASRAEAESSEDETAGAQELKAQRAIAAAMEKDKLNAPSFLGYNGSGEEMRLRTRDLHLIQDGVEVPLG